MELKEIKELIKIIKDENLEDLKINVNGEKLHLINSTENVQINVEQISKTSIESEPVELLAQAEIIKSSNVGKIKLLYLEKGMHIKKGAKLIFCSFFIFYLLNNNVVATCVGYAALHGMCVEVAVTDFYAYA